MGRILLRSCGFASWAIVLASISGCGEEEQNAANTPGYIAPVLDKPIEAPSTKLQEMAAQAPVWGPSAEMQNVLSNQWLQVGPYKLPIPAGHFAKTERSETTISPNRSDGITGLMIRVEKRRRIEGLNFTFDQLTNNERFGVENQFRNARLSDAEVGKIGGIVFSRFAYSGAIQSGHPVKGALYAAYDGDWEIVLHLEVDSTDDTNLFAFEAAALSFQRQ